MRVVVAASEMAPLAKTGGLGDVAGALPRALAELGQDVTVFLPLYRSVVEGAQAFEPLPLPPVRVPVGEEVREATLVSWPAPGSSVKVVLIRNDPYFYRDGLYVDPVSGEDYADNCARFVFFCRAVLESLISLGVKPDVIHCHDWQTGLIPLYLRTAYSANPLLSGAKSVFTIHNMAYQGRFGPEKMADVGVGRQYFNWRQLESHGDLCLLKSGLVFADALTTVSPTYAQQIQTPQFGWRLDGVIRERATDLSGILNGIDTETWDPATDANLPAQFSTEHPGGKRRCKSSLQKEIGLKPARDALLVGMIGRLVEQKGFDLVASALGKLIPLRVQLAILGAPGDEGISNVLKRTAAQHPDSLSFNVGFNERLAHRMYAGSDVMLVPSRFEPCGLAQLCGLRYGAVPVVHGTGGLADTVTDFTPDRLDSRQCNGFTFTPCETGAMVGALSRAAELFRSRRRWKKLVHTCMSQDWSWGSSAQRYLDLFRRLAVST